MSKQYFMPGSDLTEEQRQSIKDHQQKQDVDRQERLARRIEMSAVERQILIKKLMDTNIGAVEDRIVVYPDPPDQITEGGIIIPDDVQNRQKPLRGTVIVVGPGKVDSQSVTNFLLLNILTALHAPADQIQDCKKATGDLLTIPCKPGDRVMYGRYAGTPVVDEETEEELLIMRLTDIFVKL